MAKQASNFTWEAVPAAARRLDRNAGHLRKLVAGLAEQGKARRVKPANGKWHWEVRSDVSALSSLPSRRLSAMKPSKPVTLHLGRAVISIQGDCGLEIFQGRVSIIDAASERSSSGDSAGFDGRLRTPRRSHKSGSKTRRSHPD
jgi:hypothetical protein